jgi:signal transduction histidine kinase
MNKSLKKGYRTNVLILTLTITAIFLLINISLYIINNNYLINKVKEENSAFLLVTTHIINENDISVALEYAEHYSHIHLVEIEIIDQEGNMIFSTSVSHRYASQYQVETNQGNFTVFIDNTESVTVTSIETNTIYINIALSVIYLASLFIILKTNKINANLINKDIKRVLELIENDKSNSDSFNYIEFKYIYDIIYQYLSEIDLLTEQKEMNMKGLAHDIKTPLTIVYSYFQDVLNKRTISAKDMQNAFDASKQINSLLNDLIENKQHIIKTRINVTDFIKKKLNEYEVVLNSKEIKIESEISDNVFIEWNRRDLSRVIDNLISNAYYYSKYGSKVRLNLLFKGRAIIEIISTPEDFESIDKEQIFKKGYRGPTSKASNSYGKGYGLYLARLLLRKIDGDIQLDIKEGNVKFTIIL